MKSDLDWNNYAVGFSKPLGQGDLQVIVNDLEIWSDEKMT